MDSFYDQPRKPPASRTPFISTEKILPAPVPDASMLIHNSGNVPQKKTEMSYNAWKLQHKSNMRPGNKENVCTAPTQLSANDPSLYRKQVRFESPNVQILQTIPQNKETSNVRSCLPPKPPLNPILQPKLFEKIYMANIPNRVLDLSVIEPPRRPENAVKTDYRFENFKPPILESTNMQFSKRFPSAESTAIEQKQIESTSNVLKQAESDEPTVKDLLKIIQQQNEQLMCLQKQVATLLQERDCTKNQIEGKCETFANKSEVKSNVPKFAIDVMTSFEVSFRPPNNFHNKRNVNNGPKIQEITEGSLDEKFNVSKPNDVSLVLEEPVVVREECPSPQNSIHVDMQDYSSESEEEESSSLIGWTIYNNVMDQVNCLLKKSQGENIQMKPDNKFNENTIRKVKEATLKHLKSVGVNLKNVTDDDTFATNDSELQCTPTQISFAVKQLLMKYLPDEQLARITNRQDTEPKDYPTNLIKRRPEFSLATVQYMEKYNLLNKDSKVPTQNKQKIMNRKMLDITALKQQPKLL